MVVDLLRKEDCRKIEKIEFFWRFFILFDLKREVRTLSEARGFKKKTCFWKWLGKRSFIDYFTRIEKNVFSSVWILHEMLSKNLFPFPTNAYESFIS